jgi:hypothetical protein
VTDSAPDAPDDRRTAPAPARARRRRAVAVAAGLAAAAVFVAGAAVLRDPPRHGGLVILYGDSMSTEASGAFVEALRRDTDAEVITRPVPGASPCDALPQMRDDLALEPTVVVLQYVGNNGSPCMRGPDGRPLTGDALAERTIEDVRAATEMFAERGTRVVLVGGPDAPGLPGGATLRIAEGYHDIAHGWAGRDLGRVRYADAAAAVTDGGRYVDRLPCRDGEGPDEGCVDGEVTVRNPDRIHFCPVEPEGLTCPVPSPGARRFGEEMARVAATALDPDL